MFSCSHSTHAQRCTLIASISAALYVSTVCHQVSKSVFTHCVSARCQHIYHPCNIVLGLCVSTTCQHDISAQRVSMTCQHSILT